MTGREQLGAQPSFHFLISAQHNNGGRSKWAVNRLSVSTYVYPTSRHVIKYTRPSPTFHTASDKSWGCRPGNKAYGTCANSMYNVYKATYIQTAYLGNNRN